MRNDLTARKQKSDKSYECPETSPKQITEPATNKVAFWVMVFVGAFLALMYLGTPWRNEALALIFVSLNTLVPTILVGWMVYNTSAYKRKNTAHATAAAMLLFVIPINLIVVSDLAAGGGGQMGFTIIFCMPLIFGLGAAGVVYLLGGISDFGGDL